MARQSRAQKETVERVMHEFRQGELEMRGGRKVRNPKQAIAIALHEAGASRQESPERNRRNLARTKARERQGETVSERRAEAGSRGGGMRGRPGEPTRAELYAEARRRGIPGASRMRKAALQEALRRR
jgi:Family of unknown function (DUF6496)